MLELSATWPLRDVYFQQITVLLKPKFLRKSVAMIRHEKVEDKVILSLIILYSLICLINCHRSLRGANYDVLELRASGFPLLSI